jgi:hypothetical protein
MFKAVLLISGLVIIVTCVFAFVGYVFRKHDGELRRTADAARHKRIQSELKELGTFSDEEDVS